MSSPIDDDRTPVCLVIGAGDDTGAAIARAFAMDGLTACVARRPRHADKLEALCETIRAAGGTAHATPCDARDGDAVDALVARIEAEIGPIAVLVFNIGANVRFDLSDTTPRVFRKVWEMACFAGFLSARAVTPHMVARGAGTIIFTGATASVRGSAGFSAFASAKAGLRILAQSAARELGPKGIHVVHAVIDGMIDSAFIRDNVPNADGLRDVDALIDPDAIAANYVNLHHQARNAWTHEIDLRPWKETW